MPKFPHIKRAARGRRRRSLIWAALFFGICGPFFTLTFLGMRTPQPWCWLPALIFALLIVLCLRGIRNIKHEL